MSTQHRLSKNQTTLLSSCSVCGKTKRAKAEAQPPLGKPDFVTLHRATKAFDLAHAHPEHDAELARLAKERPELEPGPELAPTARVAPPPLFPPSTMTAATPASTPVGMRDASLPPEGTKMRAHGEPPPARVSVGQGAGPSARMTEAAPSATVASALISGTSRIGGR